MTPPQPPQPGQPAAPAAGGDAGAGAADDQPDQPAQGDAKKQLLDLLLKVVASAVSVTGVAVIGSAVTWARFEAADLPANQAITVVGRDEMVAIGAISLTLFVLAGVLAVAVVFVLDKTASPEQKRTRYGIAVLVAIGVIGGSILSLDGWTLVYAIVAVAIAFGVLFALTKDETTAQIENPDVGVWARRLGPIVLAALALVIPGVAEQGRAWFPLLFLAVAASLGGLCIGIAKQTGTIFRWYGVAVFLSVVLFGAVVSIARTFNTPKVQPVAVLLRTEPALSAVSGVYIADSDDRIYIGSFELENGGTSDQVKARNGAIYWVPCDRVVTYAVGNELKVPEALQRARVLASDLEGLAEKIAPDTATAATGTTEEAAPPATGTAGEEIRGSCKS